MSQLKDNFLSVIAYGVPAIIGLGISTLTWSWMIFTSIAVLAVWAFWISREKEGAMIMVSIFPFAGMVLTFASGLAIRFLL